MVQYLLLNLRYPFKAFVKNERFFSLMKTLSYIAQDEVLKSLQTVPVFLTCSSGMRIHKTSMSYHILLFFATSPQIRTSALPSLPFLQVNS